jgi:hypothetical protein
MLLKEKTFLKCEDLIFSFTKVLKKEATVLGDGFFW